MQGLIIGRNECGLFAFSSGGVYLIENAQSAALPEQNPAGLSCEIEVTEDPTWLGTGRCLLRECKSAVLSESALPCTAEGEIPQHKLLWQPKGVLAAGEGASIEEALSALCEHAASLGCNALLKLKVEVHLDQAFPALCRLRKCFVRLTALPVLIDGPLYKSRGLRKLSFGVDEARHNSPNRAAGRARLILPLCLTVAAGPCLLVLSQRYTGSWEGGAIATGFTAVAALGAACLAQLRSVPLKRGFLLKSARHHTV